MKRSMIIPFVLALAGCGTFGHTSYSVKANAAGGYDIEARDGKEYADGRSIMFDAAKGQMVIKEGASKAFKGQAIGAKVMTMMPVTGLQDLAE